MKFIQYRVKRRIFLSWYFFSVPKKDDIQKFEDFIRFYDIYIDIYLFIYIYLDIIKIYCYNKNNKTHDILYIIRYISRSNNHIKNSGVTMIMAIIIAIEIISSKKFSLNIESKLFLIILIRFIKIHNIIELYIIFILAIWLIIILIIWMILAFIRIDPLFQIIFYNQSSAISYIEIYSKRD